MKMDIVSLLNKDELLVISKGVFTSKVKFGEGLVAKGEKGTYYGGEKTFYGDKPFEDDTIEQIAILGMTNVHVQIYRYIYPGGLSGGESNFDYGTDLWQKFKAEFRILICTRDKKYASLRTQIERAGSKSQLTITSAMSAALSPHIGIAAGFLVPFCAICLVAVLKLGREAFCKRDTLNITPA